MVTIASNAGSVSATVRRRAITAVITCSPFAAYALQVHLRLSTTVIVMLLATFILIAVDRSRSSQQGVLAESQGHNRSYQIFQVGFEPCNLPMQVRGNFAKERNALNEDRLRVWEFALSFN